MRVLVTGYGGQLGYDVVRELERRKIDASASAGQSLTLRILPLCEALSKAGRRML